MNGSDILRRDTVALDEKTSVLTPHSAIAATSASVPPTLLS